MTRSPWFLAPESSGRYSFCGPSLEPKNMEGRPSLMVLETWYLWSHFLSQPKVASSGSLHSGHADFGTGLSPLPWCFFSPPGEKASWAGPFSFERGNVRDPAVELVVSPGESDVTHRTHISRRLPRRWGLAVGRAGGVRGGGRAKRRLAGGLYRGMWLVFAKECYVGRPLLA